MIELQSHLTKITPFFILFFVVRSLLKSNKFWEVPVAWDIRATFLDAKKLFYLGFKNSVVYCWPTGPLPLPLIFLGSSLLAVEILSIIRSGQYLAYDILIQRINSPLMVTICYHAVIIPRKSFSVQMIVKYAYNNFRRKTLFLLLVYSS